ncbi:MAG: hypothetical protein U1E86_28185 [Burkholderiaceae bacterium]
MKLVIFGVAAFLIGIGGTTGTLVLTAPKLPAGADSLIAAAHADTTKHEAAAHAAPGAEHAAAPAESTLAHEAAPAGEATPAEPEGAAAPAEHTTDAATAAHQAAIEPVRVPPVVARPGAAEPDPETYKQVGSILMNMKPAEAAKIMGYLNDTQIEGLLRSMSPRNAATVLSQMPPERAAALSRRLLVPAKEARP